MEITIDIKDYLDESEIKDIVCEVFSDEVRRIITKNGDNGIEKQVERIIGNSALHTITEILNKHYNKDIESIIINHVNKVAREGTLTYHIFRKKDIWDNDSSMGEKILEKAVKDNQEIIEKRVADCINTYDVSESVRDAVINAIDNRISNLNDILNIMTKDC